MNSNNMKIYGLFLLVSIVFACKPNVYFHEPVPPNVEAADQIPEKYWGLYYFDSDSSLVIVRSDIILSESVLKFTTTLNRIVESENCMIKDGGLHLRGRDECFPFEYKNEDTIVVNITKMDTVFSFSNEEVLKLKDDKAYLNLKNAEHEWVTMIIEKDKNSDHYLMYLVIIPNKKKVVRSISSNYRMRYKGDSTEVFIIKPNSKEFKKATRQKYLKLYERIIPVTLEFENN